MGNRGNALCNKNELANAPESVGEAIRANTNKHVTLIMDEAHQVVPSSKEKVEHTRELRRKYSDKPIELMGSMKNISRRFKLLYAVVGFAVMALAFAGLPWAWTVEISDATSPIGALALVIRGFSAVIVLCVIVVTLQWASRAKT